MEPSRGRRNRIVGVALFLAVTACWILWIASIEQGWVDYNNLLFLLAAAVSTASVVATGYLGRVWDALWLGWIPGATMMAVGFAMTPEPGGDEVGGGMIFLGGLLLALGWPAFFFPLITIGSELRGRRTKASQEARLRQAGG